MGSHFIVGESSGLIRHCSALSADRAWFLDRPTHQADPNPGFQSRRRAVPRVGRELSTGRPRLRQSPPGGKLIPPSMCSDLAPVVPSPRGLDPSTIELLPNVGAPEVRVSRVQTRSDHSASEGAETHQVKVRLELRLWRRPPRPGGSQERRPIVQFLIEARIPPRA